MKVFELLSGKNVSIDPSRVESVYETDIDGVVGVKMHSGDSWWIRASISAFDGTAAA